jgi:hypothetical protein
MNGFHARRIAALAFFLSCAVQPASRAAVATFDGLTEGFHGSELIAGGIRFLDPDDYAPGGLSLFSIDRADGNLGDDPFFSAPNGLAMDGFVPGPDGGGNRFGSIRFELESGGRGQAASVDLFINLLDGANRLVLAAYLGDALVAATAVTGPVTCCDVHERLSLSGVVFDDLKLFGTGPFERGAAFLLVDNVHIEEVPLPGGLLLLASACALLGRPASSRRGRGPAPPAQRRVIRTALPCERGRLPAGCTLTPAVIPT